VEAYGGSPVATIDAATGVSSLYATMPAASFLGKSLREMIQDRCNVAQGLSSALRPRFFIGLDDTAGATTFGPPMLNTYDGALSPAASATLSDVGPWSGTTYPIYEYEDALDGTRVVNRRQGTYAGGGAVVGSADNPYSGHAKWADVPVALDTGDATVAQAEIDRIVAQTANVRQSIRVTTNTWIKPGVTVAVHWALDGLAGTLFRVVGVDIEWPPVQSPTANARYTLTLGQRRLLLNEEGDEGVDVPPADGDNVAPIPPNSPTVVQNLWREGEGGGRAAIICSTTNSVSPDVAAHRLNLTYNGVAAYSPWIEATGPSPITTTFPIVEVLPGASVSAAVQARDTNNNVSAFGTGTVFTAAKKPKKEPDPWEHQTPDHSDTTLYLGGWTSSVTGDGARALNTSVVFQGTRSIQLTATTGTATLDSDAFQVTPAAVYSATFSHDALFAIGTLLVQVRWQDKAGADLSQSTVYSAAPSAPPLETSVQVTAPASATQAIVRMRYTGDNATLNTVIVGPLRWFKAALVKDTNLRTQSGAGLPIYDQNGANETTHHVDSTSHDYTITTIDGVQLILGLGTTEITEDITLAAVQAGNIDANSLATVGDVTVGDDLEVTGTSLFTGDATFDGNATFNSDVYVTSLSTAVNGIYVAKSATFTAGAEAVGYTCTGTITANLPSAATVPGRWYEIINAGTGVVTVDPNGAQTVGGRTTWLLGRDSSLIIYSDASNWQVRAGHNHNSGTAFPTTGLYAGLEYTRTDLRGVRCTYDGTRWLGPELPIAEHNYLGSPPFSATTEVLAGGLRTDLALYVTRFTMSFYTGGGVDLTNYWRVYMRYLDSGSNLQNMVYIQTANNGWTNAGDKVPADMSNNPIPAGSIWVQTYIEKTLSPNPLYVQYAAWGCYVYS
jgi:hypothetical protein